MARVAVVLGSGGARGYAHLGAVEALRDRGHELVAVSLQGPREPHEPMSPARGLSVRSAAWAMDLRRRFGRSGPDADDALDDTSGQRLEPLDAESPGPEPPELELDVRTSEVLTQSFDAMQSLITRYRLAALPPDVLVTVPISAARTLDFHRAEELIELGRSLADAALDDAGR